MRGCEVIRSNVGRAMRQLRHHRGWRQSDLALRTGLSREAVSRVERGQLHGLSVATLERLATGLDASIDVMVRWRGEELDRLVDAAHAALEEAVSRFLADSGWLAHVEVSFNEYGDRGRVDVLALHRSTGTLLVIEVKSGIRDLQDTLGKLNVKARLGRTIAATVGWGDVRLVVPMLVVADSRRARRVLADHPSLFAHLPTRGRQAVAWIRRPAREAPAGLLWLLKLPDSHGMTVTRRQRVRSARNGR